MYLVNMCLLSMDIVKKKKNGDDDTFNTQRCLLYL